MSNHNLPFKLPTLTTQVKNEGLPRPSAKKPSSEVSLPPIINTRYSDLRKVSKDSQGAFDKVNTSKRKKTACETLTKAESAPSRLLPLQFGETLPRPPIKKVAFSQNVETIDDKDTSTSSTRLKSSSILIPFPLPEPTSSSSNSDPEKRLKLLAQYCSSKYLNKNSPNLTINNMS